MFFLWPMRHQLVVLLGAAIGPPGIWCYSARPSARLGFGAKRIEFFSISRIIHENSIGLRCSQCCGLSPRYAGAHCCVAERCSHSDRVRSATTSLARGEFERHNVEMAVEIKKSVGAVYEKKPRYEKLSPQKTQLFSAKL